MGAEPEEARLSLSCRRRRAPRNAAERRRGQISILFPGGEEAAIYKAKLKTHIVSAPEANDVYTDTPRLWNRPNIPRSAQRRGGGGAAGCPSPAAFLRRNLDLTPASLARRGPGRPSGAGRRAGPPQPASPCAPADARPRPAARARGAQTPQSGRSGVHFRVEILKCRRLLFDIMGRGEEDEGFALKSAVKRRQK